MLTRLFYTLCMVCFYAFDGAYADSDTPPLRIIGLNGGTAKFEHPMDSVVFHGLTPPKSKRLRTVLKTFLGEQVTPETAQMIAQTVADHFAICECPVDVTVPEQALDRGRLFLNVRESFWNSVLIVPGDYFSSQSIQHLLTNSPGQPVNSRRLTRQLDWINQHPHLSVTAEVSEFEDGATDLQLTIDDTDPFQVFTTYDNSGVALLGQSRFSAGFQWGNAWGIGDQWTLMALASDEADNFHGLATRYVHLLPWMHALELDAYYIDTALRQTLLGSSIEGTNWGISANYRVPLKGDPAGSYSHDVVLGVDYKQSDSDLVFGNLLTFSDTAIIQGRVGYEATLRDKWGATKADLAWVFSPGNLSNANSDASFGQSHVGAESTYHYARLRLERVQRLAFDATLYTKGAIQWSSERLLPSEQMSVGGAQNVRGFDEHSALGDWGAWGSLELRSPRLEWRQSELQLICFVEGGLTGLKGVHDRQRLVSTGLGLRFQIADHVSGFFDYGWGLNRTGGEAHIGIRAQY
ncbi:hypothetical protein N8586_00015 [Verrucomicrobiales bacterium]|nr:hypothetical protein [Verrucomicrobiales bacterium]